MIECQIDCEEQKHRIGLRTNGEFVLFDHDIYEEEARWELGDETSDCYRTLRVFQDNPVAQLYVAAHMGDLVRARMAIRAGANPQTVHRLAISPKVTEENPDLEEYFSAREYLILMTSSPLNPVVMSKNDDFLRALASDTDVSASVHKIRSTCFESLAGHEKIVDLYFKLLSIGSSLVKFYSVIWSPEAVMAAFL